jgi:hypothetical protein
MMQILLPILLPGIKNATIHPNSLQTHKKAVFSLLNRIILPGMKYISQLFMTFTLFIVTSCQPAPKLEPGQTLNLATSAENKVEVTISLTRDLSGQFILSATFTPELLSLHLYSKEIPRNGVEGLGRPTLLELAEDSVLKSNGELSENTVSSQSSSFDPEGLLLLYPAGPVTLSLPVLLPEGNNWINDRVLVTYMACDGQGCRAPVQLKPIAIRIPSLGLFQ